MRTRLAFGAAAVVASAVALTPNTADACGGCFVPATENTVVTGHRMAMSISTTQSVLWDQIQYAGNPEDFSWVLPIKPGGRVEVSTDAWFETLEAATTVTVQAPPEGCGSSGGSGFGCGSADSVGAAPNAYGGYADDGVQVVHKGTVGPYETVTLSATDPSALNDWLEGHGYSVPDDIQPTIDAYVDENFDFIALKLQPGQGVQQMRPVRVISPGAVYSLPLRMVAAGTGSNTSVILYLISEGRLQTANFDNGYVPPTLVTWDFLSDQSDYSELRSAVLAGNEGRTWITAYANAGGLLRTNWKQGFSNSFQVAGANGFPTFASSIAEAYVQQGFTNDEEDQTESACLDAFVALQDSKSKVVELCDENGENCDQPADGEIDASTLACGALDDIATALVGMHPADVWLTRVEAELPRTALDADLLLEAADDQQDVSNFMQAGLSLNNCHDRPAAFISGSGKGLPPMSPRDIGLVMMGGLALFLYRRRRAQSRRRVAVTR